MKTTRRVLIIGSEPTKNEYDYACALACQALRAKGFAVILLHPNPAALCCGRGLADALYLQALNADTVKRIALQEKADCILPLFGGDAGIALALELHNSNWLKKQGVALLGITPEQLAALQSPKAFRETLERANEPAVAAQIAIGAAQIAQAAMQIGCPVTLRAVSGGRETVCNDEEMLQGAAAQFGVSVPVQAEKNVSGRRELECILLRDAAGESVCFAMTECLDPVGIHPGDSICVTPPQTLTAADEARLCASARHIADALDIRGCCTLRFALCEDGGDYAVLAADPCPGRAAAFAAKVTDYAVAETAVRLMLDERLADCPPLVPPQDVCVSFPKWSFDSFDEASRSLGTAMQSTGEAMARGRDFTQALLQAARSAHAGVFGLALPKYRNEGEQELLERIRRPNDERIFALYEALSREIPLAQLQALCGIHPWFLSQLQAVAALENQLRGEDGIHFTAQASEMGFTQEAIARLTGIAPPKIATLEKAQEGVLVIGSGPCAIGQGNELEYGNLCVMQALRQRGETAYCVNNNPQALTTDSAVIAPITAQDVRTLVQKQSPKALLLQFAGESALSIARALADLPVAILGADARILERIATADSRRLFLRDLAVPFAAKYPFTATGFETEVLCDGADILIPGFTEHIERSGAVHAGDSVGVYPPVSISSAVLDEAAQYARKIALALGLRGIFHLQFALYDHKLYVTDISPRALRTVPFLEKATGLPVMALAARCTLGDSLSALGCGTGVHPAKPGYAVRVPVFNFHQLDGADATLGKKMKSTGEVIGMAARFEDALLQALRISGMQIKRGGTVLFSLRNEDKQAAIDVAEKFAVAGFKLLSTAGTARLFNANCVPSSAVRKLTQEPPNIADVIEEGRCVYIVSTSESHKAAREADRKIRRRALEKQIPIFTNLDTARVFIQALSRGEDIPDAQSIISKNEEGITL